MHYVQICNDQLSMATSVTWFEKRKGGSLQGEERKADDDGRRDMGGGSEERRTWIRDSASLWPGGARGDFYICI